MKLATGIGALAVLSFVAILWISGGDNSLLSMGLFAGLGLGAIAITGGIVKWLRNRRRRQIMDMRDSALW
ncbi:hypothetical protein [Rhodoferax sp.]|jgi:hypothetical protein|uniref:hypothetical protein n=1 Tax=Rhodoferax sp. TaxID=50421 RepID=UPI0027178D5D|nr:hypothetical protein [Rhodoferax sp.]MDO9145344.1 hypothetical protein [Rhodoferax sp.]MDP2440394.1 hypothetical protein [Rhodoferax sp.]MDP3866313.1 hypothetical protein [Rhodoferax sp.]MDZ4206247.1 hypothetical protein [Rhodoferax sp.]